MDEDGTKVLLKQQQQPLQFNRIYPNYIDNDPANSEGDPESELPDVNDIKGTQRSEQAPPVKETIPPN